MLKLLFSNWCENGENDNQNSISKETPWFEPSLEVCVSGAFEGLEESLKTSKMASLTNDFIGLWSKFCSFEYHWIQITEW